MKSFHHQNLYGSLQCTKIIGELICAQVNDFYHVDLPDELSHVSTTSSCANMHVLTTASYIRRKRSTSRPYASDHIFSLHQELDEQCRQEIKAFLLRRLNFIDEVELLDWAS